MKFPISTALSEKKYIRSKRLIAPYGVTRHPILDSFSDDRPTGKVIGSKSPSGVERKGIDVEKRIGIDHGALRIQPLRKPGWGRAGIVYGQFIRKNGLAFAVHLLNGHNASQSGEIPEGFWWRVIDWLRASQQDIRVRYLLLWLLSPNRLLRLISGGQMKKALQRLLYWTGYNRRHRRLKINENLAVGFFPNETPENPPGEGNNFVVHSLGPENGALWTRVGKLHLSAVHGLKNLQLYLVVILRERGAAYYVASVPKAKGLAAFPSMRPVGIDVFNQDKSVYAAIYQSVLGQVGFRVDTRVYAAHVETIPELENWYGTAHAADKLTGFGALNQAVAETGGSWLVFDGEFTLGERGARPAQKNNIAILEPNQPSGLIHFIVDISQPTNERLSFIWRVKDPDNFWELSIGVGRCELRIKEKGNFNLIATDEKIYLQPDGENSVQVIDDGEELGIYLNGRLVFDKNLSDARFAEKSGMGVYSADPVRDIYLRFLEAHPRHVAIPAELDLGEPWWPEATQLEIMDQFDGNPGELAGRITNIGSEHWRREIGNGSIALTGHGAAKVKASSDHPNPGRTAYTLAWDDHEFADLQVDITPPGTKRGQGESCKGGFIFWQDEENYIILNCYIDDGYGGGSLSTFFYLNGSEDLYDAVWANVGEQIYWGKTLTLRMVFDGMRYMAFINDEPILYRALTDVYPDMKRLAINRVGIVANWEFGNDTGTVFKNFTARRKNRF